MKKINPTNILSTITVLLFVICFFMYPEVLLSGAKNGLNVCFNVIIPSLFPFLIISSFFVKSGLAEYENKITKFVAEKIFRLPSASLSIILMSLIGGFPVGIRMTEEMYKSKKINQNEAQRLSLFCVNAGPAFVINAVGVLMLKNKKAGIIIFISLTITSVIIGIFSRFFAKGEITKNEKIGESKKISDALVNSVADSSGAIISICSWIIIVSTFISLADVLGSIGVFIKAFSEVTTGCTIFSKNHPYFFLAGIIGFGGLCVHLQLLPSLNKMKIKLSTFFMGRICSSLLSAMICKILFEIFPCEVLVISNISQATSGGLSVSIPAVGSLLFMCVMLILDLSLDRSKKIC